MPRVGGSEVAFEVAQSLRKKFGRNQDNVLTDEDENILEVMSGSRFFFRLFPPRKISLLFRTEEQLGSGGFGSVMRALPTKKGLDRIPGLEANKSYALKQMKLRRSLAGNGLLVGAIVRGMSAERVYQIGELLTEPNDAHVLRFYAAIVEFPQHIYMVQERLEGPDVYDFLADTRTPFSEPQAAELAKQLLTALNFLHCSVGLVHRDVKPENLVFVSPPTEEAKRGEAPLPPVKLIDLGLSYMLPAAVVDEAELSELIPVPRAGTPMYMAPETWTGMLGPSTDVWSAGMIIYLLISLSLPFGLAKGPASERIRRILTECELQLKFPEEQWSDISEAAKDFVAAVLQKDAGLRPSAGALLRTSTWFEKSEPEEVAPRRSKTCPMFLLDNRSTIERSTEDGGSTLSIFELMAAGASV